MDETDVQTFFEQLNKTRAEANAVSLLRVMMVRLTNLICGSVNF